jgi:hypothetical protein
MMDKTMLNRAAARLSELWILYPFTGSNCKKTVSNQGVDLPNNMQMLLPIAHTTRPLLRSVTKVFLPDAEFWSQLFGCTAWRIIEINQFLQILQALADRGYGCP